MHPEKFEVSKYLIPIYATKDGYVTKLDALTIGISSMRLGGGRETLDDVIDMSAGIILNKKVGDKVSKGELLCTLHTNKEDIEEIKRNVLNAFEITDKKVILKNEHILIS